MGVQMPDLIQEGSVMIEFLLQGEGDQTWLPLEASAEILEGHYRLGVRVSHPHLSVEVKLIYREPGSVSSLLEKHYGKTDAEGLMVLSPLTHFQPGLWEVHCAREPLSDLLGDSWHQILKLQVLPRDGEDGDWLGDWGLAKPSGSEDSEDILKTDAPDPAMGAPTTPDPDASPQTDDALAATLPPLIPTQTTNPVPVPDQAEVPEPLSPDVDPAVPVLPTDPQPPLEDTSQGLSPHKSGLDLYFLELLNQPQDTGQMSLQPLEQQPLPPKIHRPDLTASSPQTPDLFPLPKPSLGSEPLSSTDEVSEPVGDFLPDSLTFGKPQHQDRFWARLNALATDGSLSHQLRGYEAGPLGPKDAALDQDPWASDPWDAEEHHRH